MPPRRWTFSGKGRRKGHEPPLGHRPPRRQRLADDSRPEVAIQIRARLQGRIQFVERPEDGARPDLGLERILDRDELVAALDEGRREVLDSGFR